MIESKRSESIANLAASLAVAQGQIRTATKSETADTGKFKYKYASLDGIWDVARKPLSENGLSVIQIPTNDEDTFYLETILLHSSGEWISGRMILPVASGRMSELQAMGSAITYARRYMLSAMTGVTTGDDDDGQSAAGAEQKQEMTKEKLLGNLNKVSKIAQFYKNPDEILVLCRDGKWPAGDDLKAWRELFIHARDHALEIGQESPEIAPWRPTKQEFFEAAAERFGLQNGDIADELQAAGFTGYKVDQAAEMWAALEAAEQAAE